MTTVKQNSLIDAYVLLAWEILRGEDKKGERYRNVHTTFTPFNRVFRKLFNGTDPIAYTKMLAEKGEINLMHVRGGALIQPNEALLRPAPAKHKQTIESMRRLLENEAAAAKAAAELRLQQKHQRDIKSDCLAASLKKLGY